MYKVIALCLLAVGCAGFAYADDSAEMPTVVRVYHVGNLVSTDGIDAGSGFFGQATLLAKSRFTKAESAELLSFIHSPCNSRSRSNLGSRTSWGDPDRPSTLPRFASISLPTIIF